MLKTDLTSSSNKGISRENTENHKCMNTSKESDFLCNIGSQNNSYSFSKILPSQRIETGELSENMNEHLILKDVTNKENNLRGLYKKEAKENYKNIVTYGKPLEKEEKSNNESETIQEMQKEIRNLRESLSYVIKKLNEPKKENYKELVNFEINQQNSIGHLQDDIFAVHQENKILKEEIKFLKKSEFDLIEKYSNLKKENEKGSKANFQLREEFEKYKKKNKEFARELVKEVTKKENKSYEGEILKTKEYLQAKALNFLVENSSPKSQRGESRKAKLSKKISALFHNAEPKAKTHRECHSQDIRSLTSQGEVSRLTKRERGESFNDQCLTLRNTILEEKGKHKRSSTHNGVKPSNQEKEYFLNKKYEVKPKRESSRNARTKDLSNLLMNYSKRKDKKDSLYEPKSLSSRIHNEERYSKLLQELS